jgi:thymidine kinase
MLQTRHHIKIDLKNAWFAHLVNDVHLFKTMLVFRYGVMNSGKTAALLMLAHQFDVLRRNVLVLKPAVDTRTAASVITSRVGIARDVDIVVHAQTNLGPDGIEPAPSLFAVLVDEAQFLSVAQIDQLRQLALRVRVVCYGLKTDYRGHLFPASQRLFEVADVVEEMTTLCTQCDSVASRNVKFNGDVFVRDGDSTIDIGTEDKYIALCFGCFYASLAFSRVSDFRSTGVPIPTSFPIADDIVDDAVARKKRPRMCHSH